MKPRPNLQFLAEQGDRLLGISFPPNSPTVGKQAAPEVSPSSGVATLSDNVGVIVRQVEDEF